MRYELYYWGGIQGRGEFVRLALEEAGVPYTDVARRDEAAMLRLLKEKDLKTPSFAPPFLRAGKLLIGQTATILLYLGDHHGLAPRSEAGRLWAHQLQLTVADLVAEVHDTHHPISGGLYYEDQKPEAAKRSKAFREERLPKYFTYFGSVLAHRATGWLTGARVSYADLSLFQVVAGLRYAFPGAMRRLEPRYSELTTLHDRVAARPRVASYLKSPRRLPFSTEGIFRHYPELDV
ncbi:MAG: glutathione S-transferase [Rhizomicrobium sp.]|jgi:glutathione S-transferase